MSIQKYLLSSPLPKFSHFSYSCRYASCYVRYQGGPWIQRVCSEGAVRERSERLCLWDCDLTQKNNNTELTHMLINAHFVSVKKKPFCTLGFCLVRWQTCIAISTEFPLPIVNWFIHVPGCQKPGLCKKMITSKLSTDIQTPVLFCRWNIFAMQNKICEGLDP